MARRVSEAVEARVRAAMSSDAVQQQLQQRLTAERTVLEEQVRARSPLFECLAAWCDSLARGTAEPMLAVGVETSSAHLFYWDNVYARKP